jgi:hypothetical protein
MDMVELESLARRIDEGRKEKKRIDQELIRNVRRCIEMMTSEKKRHCSVGEYSVEVLPKTINNVDMARLKEYIKQGVVDESILTSRKSEVVYIKVKSSVRLVGNSFE